MPLASRLADHHGGGDRQLIWIGLDLWLELSQSSSSAKSSIQNTVSLTFIRFQVLIDL